MDVDENWKLHTAAGNSSKGAKPKRKKTEPPDVSDDDMEAEMLRKNSFSKLTANTKQQTTPLITTPENASGKKKQPPLVVRNIGFADLVEKMKTCDARPTYKITRFGTKILCSSVEEFDTVKAYLTESKCEFYTHDKPSERPYRVVLRGLPLADPNSIMDRMKKEHGLTPLATHIIRRKGECAELDESFYLVHFAKGTTNLKQLSEVKSIGHIIVRWEAYRNKRADVTQCMNCLYHGHGTRNCHLKSRCNNCGEAHATDKCKVNAPTKRCANCNGAHAATDRNCPKRAEYIKIRQQATTSNQPGRNGIRKGLPVPDLNEKNFPSNLLPGGVQIPEGSASTSNAWNNRQKDGRKVDPRERAGINNLPSDPPEGSTDTLYGFDELWTIYNEFCDRMKQCKTKSDQVRVLGFMVCKYGVN